MVWLASSCNDFVIGELVFNEGDVAPKKKGRRIVDGYAKDTVLLPLGKLQGVRTIIRLRRDAALFEIPS